MTNCRKFTGGSEFDKIVGFGVIIHHSKSQPLSIPKSDQKVCGGGCGSGVEFFFSIQLSHSLSCTILEKKYLN